MAATTSDIEKMVSEAESKFGPVDILICNAGLSKPCLFMEDDIEEKSKMEMDLNFFGTQRCVNVLGKQMAQRGKGHILVVGTACSYTFVPGYPGYTASKFAQRGYVETIRHELRQYGVYVHLFLPGTIDTPGLKKENEIKSSLSWDIEGKSTCLTADEAAQICIKGFKEGRYQYTTETFLDLLLIPAAGNAGR